MDHFTYRDWPDAVRLTNGTAELIVVPSIGGRIMRYGLIGGENILWENPTASDKNFGGDKAWPWPQSDWKQLIGADWPPPDAYALTPCTVEQLDPLSVRITTSADPRFGFRIIREIRMSDHGTRVTLESRLVPEPGAKTVATQFAPWSVTQVPNADFILARVAEDASNPPYRPLPPHAAAGVDRIGREVLRITRPSKDAAKIGIDADILAWVNGSTFFMQRLQPASALPTNPGERAQVFLQGGDSPDEYTELEFAAPRGDLSRSVLRVTWEIHDLPRDLGTPENVAAYIVRF